MTRYTDTSDPVRGPPAEYFVRISSFHLFKQKKNLFRIVMELEHQLNDPQEEVIYI